MSIKMTKNMWVGMLALTSVISAPTIAQTTTYSSMGCQAHAPGTAYSTWGAIQNEDATNVLAISCPIPYTGTTAKSFKVNVSVNDLSKAGGVDCATVTATSPPNTALSASWTAWFPVTTAAEQTLGVYKYFELPTNTIKPGPYSVSSLECRLGKKDGNNLKTQFNWYTVTIF